MKPPNPLGIAAVSIGCGVVFATGAAFGSDVPEGLLFAWIAGGVVGFLASPAAAIALADSECRPSFQWVFWPTLVVATLGGVIGGPSVALVGSVTVYIASGLAAGAFAHFWRRRRLNWYRSGRCSACGYDLVGLEAQTCPECGRHGRIRPFMRVPVELLRP